MTSFFEAIPESILNKIDSLDLNIESSNCSVAVNEALAKTVLSGGKRLRPMITYLFAELFFIDNEAVNMAASSIEMVHGASLAHDDVVDNATQRRGAPSINIVESNKKAVLAGDYLLAQVIYNLAKLGDTKLIEQMSLVIKDLALGEWIQSDAILNRTYSNSLIEQIAHYKTASVMSFCSWAPAHIAKAPLEICEAANEFGRRLGLAFQMMDDTLDFSANSDKDALLDVHNNIVNSVILQWLELNPAKFDKYKAGINLIELWSEDNLNEAVAAVKNKAQAHMDIARHCLSTIKTYLNETKVSAPSMIDEKLVPIEFVIDFIINRDF